MGCIVIKLLVIDVKVKIGCQMGSVTYVTGDRYSLFMFLSKSSNIVNKEAISECQPP